jgi:hypothetical protein
MVTFSEWLSNGLGRVPLGRDGHAQRQIPRSVRSKYLLIFCSILDLTTDIPEMFEREMPSFAAWTPEELAFVEPVIGRS